jgi:hypothetical protein
MWPADAIHGHHSGPLATSFMLQRLSILTGIDHVMICIPDLQQGIAPRRAGRRKLSCQAGERQWETLHRFPVA